MFFQTYLVIFDSLLLLTYLFYSPFISFNIVNIFTLYSVSNDFSV